MATYNNYGFGYPTYGGDVDICLVTPPSRASSQVIPNSLLFLSAWCNKNNINTRIVDIKADRLELLRMCGDEHIFKDIVNKVSELNPKIVGFTAFTTDYYDIMRLAAEIKKRINPTIVVGGIHAQIVPEDFLVGESPIDFVALGDGEDTLVKLADAVIHGNGSIESVPMLARGNGASITRNNDNGDFIDYSIMPMLPYWDLDMDFYARPNKGVIRFLLASGIHIFTALGCPYKCTFCANHKTAISLRPLSKVIEEIDFCKQTYGIDSFYIQDDTFCTNESRVDEFIGRLGSLREKYFWGCETRVNLLSRHMARKLHNAGCMQIDFGVESGSRAVLNRMKKGISLKQIEQAFSCCRKENIRTLANFMFNTPEETEKDVLDTINLARKIKPTIVICGLTVPYIGTPIYNQYIKPPLEKEDYHMYITRVYRRDRVDVFRGKFKLAVHDLDLKRILSRFVMRHMWFRRFFDFTWKLKYWRCVWRSKRRFQYFNEFMENIFYVKQFLVSRMTQKSHHVDDIAKST